MRYQTFGKTHLSVSEAGLGCGGPSRLGLATGSSTADAVELVRMAVDLGINFIDTSPLYGTEGVVGEALVGTRQTVVLATKCTPVPAAELRQSVEKSLAILRTDYIDILFLHGVSPAAYPNCVDTLLPELESFRSAGKIRFFGLTEALDSDPDHAMLKTAVPQSLWDCVMFGFSAANLSARDTVLPLTSQANIGTVVMRAARDVLRKDENATKCGAENAYRNVIRTPGVHVVLTGTGSAPHLAANVAAIINSS